MNPYIFMMWKGFLGGSDSKESACKMGYLDVITESGRSPGEGHGDPLQFPCLENSVDGGAWHAPVHGVTKSQTTEWLTLSLHFMMQRLPFMLNCDSCQNLTHFSHDINDHFARGMAFGYFLQLPISRFYSFLGANYGASMLLTFQVKHWCSSPVSWF